jgi:hypothetical protein
MKRQQNMCHKPKEEVFVYALLHARANLMMQAKSMSSTTTKTTRTATAAATEGHRGKRR